MLTGGRSRWPVAGGPEGGGAWRYARAMTTARARLVAVPLAAALIVAIAVGTAAHQSPANGPADQQASIDAATVVLTLLGMALALGVAYFAWSVLTAERRRGQRGGTAPARPSWRQQLVVSALALALVVGAWLLVVLWPATGHHGGGGGLPHGLRLPPSSKPLPYDAAVGGLTAASAAAALAVVALAYGLRRRLGRLRRHRPAFLADLPATAGDLTADVMAGLRGELAALAIPDPRSEPDPRRAVIAAWTAMTEAIGAHWRRRAASETPVEYLREALTGAGVGPAAAGRLTSLFEQARWGGGAVGEEMRGEAILALDAVRAELRAHEPALPELPVAG